MQMPKVARLHGILWGVFSAGGFIAAFLLPVLIYVVGIAYPLGLWPVNGQDPTSSILAHHHLGTLFLFVTVAGSLYHGIFRFQSTLTEVGLARAKRVLEVIGYLIIIIGILATAIYLLQYGNWSFFSLP
jgi:succinate dehydrogenase subunit D